MTFLLHISVDMLILFWNLNLTVCLFSFNRKIQSICILVSVKVVAMKPQVEAPRAKMRVSFKFMFNYILYVFNLNFK